MEKVKAYELSEMEFQEVTGGIENVQDLYKWSGFFFSQGEGFKGKKLYYVIHHFSLNTDLPPKYFLVTKDFIEEIGECAKHQNTEMINELMLTLLLENGILKI